MVMIPYDESKSKIKDPLLLSWSSRREAIGRSIAPAVCPVNVWLNASTIMFYMGARRETRSLFILGSPDFLFHSPASVSYPESSYYGNYQFFYPWNKSTTLERSAGSTKTKNLSSLAVVKVLLRTLAANRYCIAVMHAECNPDTI
jgi:hypothetical protein